MTPNFLNDVSAPASYNKVSSFVELWKLKAHIAKGSPFDAFDDLEFLTYDIMMAAAFGIHDNDSETVRHLKHLQAADLSGTSVPSVNQVFPFPSFPNPPLLQALHITTKAVATSFHKPWPRLFHLFNNMRPAMRQQYKTKETIIQSYIDESTRRFMEKGQDFTPFSAVDRMVHREAVTAQKEGRRPVFDSLLFNDSLFGYLIGGQDSTHSTLSFMVKHLAANQAAQSKLRSALYLSHRTVRGEGRRPTIQEINKAQIPYLDAFIEETLRSSAPASAIEKQTLEDITLLGHVIPKGTSIVCLLSGPTLSEAGFQVPAHLRSESSKAQVTDRLDDWAASEYAPAEFRPERWLYTDDSGEVAFSNTAGPFLAFSAGPRGCWGKRLAYLELRLMVTLLVWELDFGQLPPELENWEEEEGLFSKPKSCLVRIKSTAAAKG
ncbi:cytochrome P450 [Phlyctema vagabunda]|uniref:Cytochrome P450 n=1 Tax=Phlyctema vagabunda TaxID=108571 RepID=A0ABR4PJG5_9HELO